MEEEYNTSLIQVTEVVAAVKRLNELSERMRTNSFGFREADICHIDNIIDALHELDLYKCNAKDVLETETIKCAAVRHKLMHLPDEINREIHEAVLTARLCNEEAISKVKRQLEHLSIEADQVEQRAASVDAENDRLRPELSATKADFDASFARLNDLLAEKAAKQIELNEMREALRRANARMVELEEDSLLLAEQMAGERLQHDDTLRSLREQTTQVEHRLRGCTAKEDEKRREFLAVHAILEQSNSELTESVQEYDALQHDIAMLQVQQLDTTRQKEQMEIHKEQLKSNIDVVATQSRSMAAEHQAQVAELQKTLEDLEVKSQQQTVLKETAVAQKTEVTVRTVTVQAKEETTTQSQDTKEILKEAKQTLATKSTEMAKMRQEILDIEGRRAELEDAERAEKEGWLNPSELLESGSQKLVQFMESRDRTEQQQQPQQTLSPRVAEEASLPVASVLEIQDTLEMHRRRRQQRETRLAKEAGGRPALFRRATEFDLNSVLAYNRQIAEWREQLEHERTERLTIQSVSEKLQANIRQFNEEDAAEIRAINDQIDKLKHEKVVLEDQQSRLQSAMRTDDSRRANLSASLLDQRRQLEEARAARQSEADRLASDTERLRAEAAARSAELTDLTPKFADFERFYQRATGEYDALKRSLAALKNRKTGLEDSSRRAGQEIERLGGEVASLRRDKERRMAQSTQELDSMAEDRVRVEREIYVLGCKLHTVQGENTKLVDGANRLERDMRVMQSTWERAVPTKARIEKLRTSETRQLMSGREKDSALEAEFQANDRHFLAVLTVIMNDAEARRAILEAVASGMEAELGYVDEFLKTSADQSE